MQQWLNNLSLRLKVFQRQNLIFLTRNYFSIPIHCNLTRSLQLCFVYYRNHKDKSRSLSAQSSLENPQTTHNNYLRV